MYSRVLRSVLNMPIRLKNRKFLKIASSDFINLTPVVQKVLLSCSSNYYCTGSFPSTEHSYDQMSKDPVKRKNMIDVQAQKEIDEMLAANPELIKLQQILELEISVLEQEGIRVPAELRPRHWLELLKLKSKSKRKKYLDYLFIIEKKREKRKELQMENQLLFEEREIKKGIYDDDGSIVYGIGRNFFVRRITETTMNQLWTWNSLKAHMWGNKIVFDCGYESYMNTIELKSCVKQIIQSYALNRVHNYPFHIYLCNVNFNGPLIANLERQLPTLFDDDFPMTLTSKSYLEIFNKSQLVYLTPNSRTAMQKYDPDTIYIIGALVDKGSAKPISLAKAKEENLFMAKLPLDNYYKFGQGSNKNLAINHVFGILADAQCCDWSKALEHIPRRKLQSIQGDLLERNIRRELRFGKQLISERYEGADDQKYDNEIKQYEKTVDDIPKKNKFNFTLDTKESNFSFAARAKLREPWNK